MENECNGQLSFLDVLIRKFNGVLSSSIYRKATFSGLGTSFFSYCDFRYKINAVKTLLHRAYSISSTYQLLHKELVFLKDYFMCNGYHSSFFEKLVKKFLDKQYQPKLCVPTVSREEVYLQIPYLGQASKVIEDTLKRQLTKFYPQINFKFIHKNYFKISSFFKIKDIMLAELRSSIIYCFTCPSCQAGYVGSSTRALKVRIAEHLGQSARTGRPVHSPPHSAVREHAGTCKIRLSPDHFEIIDSSNNFDLRILESLHIKQRKPLLNNMMSAVPLHIV